MTVAIERYAAFTNDPAGGNPAGVVLEAGGLDEAAMQQIAAEVGYSETAFLSSTSSGLRIRFFAPEGEVDFCGHATIATTIALGRRDGPGDYELTTNVGISPVRAESRDGVLIASMQSPQLKTLPLDADLLKALLSTFGWSTADLDTAYSPAIGYGGNQHPVLVVRDLATLEAMEYDFDALQLMCREHNWITIQLCCPTSDAKWRSRNPFPWGGVVEDAATGAAAAALAAYLRDFASLRVGDQFEIAQGVEMARPSQLHVTLLGDTARIAGAACAIAP